MKISKIGGEMDLIKRISKHIKIFSKDVIVGIGDDAAVLKFDKKQHMVITTDMMVENDHFSLKWATPEQIGKKAIESNVSDVAVMGGLPKYALVSLSMPKDAELKFVDGLYKGMNSACKKYRTSIIGGNMAHSDEIVINICMIGFVEKKYLALRKNAKVGDLIYVSGTIGNSTAGLELLKNNKKGDSIKKHLNPEAQLKLAGKLAKLGINTMEDVSDGLASEVRNICNASKKGAIIYKDSIPLKKSTIIDAKKVNKDPYHYALYGGEDFEIVFTIPANKITKLKGLDVTCVGVITDKQKGVWLIDKDKKIPLGKGYDHFNS